MIPTPDQGPAAIAIADLNGDGKNDLVYLTTPATTNTPTLNEVVVALGNGNGTFLPQPQGVFPVNIASTLPEYGNSDVFGAIAIGDVNGDGIPDIVTNASPFFSETAKADSPHERTSSTQPRTSSF